MLLFSLLSMLRKELVNSAGTVAPGTLSFEPSLDYTKSRLHQPCLTLSQAQLKLRYVHNAGYLHLATPSLKLREEEGIPYLLTHKVSPILSDIFFLPYFSILGSRGRG